MDCKKSAPGGMNRANFRAPDVEGGQLQELPEAVGVPRRRANARMHRSPTAVDASLANTRIGMQLRRYRTSGIASAGCPAPSRVGGVCKSLRMHRS